jgi:hypothetical protein
MFLKKIGSILASVTSVMLAVVSAQAQNTSGGVGDPAGAPGDPSSSYALSGVDHVNYYNGNLNVAIPLRPILGRGSVSRTPVVSIEHQWSIIEVNGAYAPFAPVQPPLAPVYAVGSLQAIYTTGNLPACPAGNGTFQPLGPLQYIYSVDNRRGH